MNNDERDLLESIGSDDSRVGGFTSEITETTARLFLPASGEWGRPVSWTELAETCGEPFSAKLRWSTLENGRLTDNEEDITPAEGLMDHTYIHSLVEVLKTEVAADTQIRYALWPGYAEVQVDFPDLEPWAPTAGSDHGRDWFGGLEVTTASLDWILEQSLKPGFHFPVLWWPTDGAFLFANPIYHDSMYFSGPVTIRDAMRTAGIELLEISRETELPSEGD